MTNKRLIQVIIQINLLKANHIALMYSIKTLTCQQKKIFQIIVNQFLF